MRSMRADDATWRTGWGCRQSMWRESVSGRKLRLQSTPEPRLAGRSARPHITLRGDPRAPPSVHRGSGLRRTPPLPRTRSHHFCRRRTKSSLRACRLQPPTRATPCRRHSAPPHRALVVLARAATVLGWPQEKGHSRPIAITRQKNLAYVPVFSVVPTSVVPHPKVTLTAYPPVVLVAMLPVKLPLSNVSWLAPIDA
jgi:hypothetical protein